MSPHRAVFVEFVKTHGFTRGAELGVDKGVLFNMLLTGCPMLSLVGVDTGNVPKRRDQVRGIAAEFDGRASFIVGTTHETAPSFPDGHFDFVFIDADHSETSVAEDIRDWQPKVRSGGWLGGHDYNHHFPGVVRAVDRVFGKRVQQWPGSIWGVWC